MFTTTAGKAIKPGMEWNRMEPIWGVPILKLPFHLKQ